MKKIIFPMIIGGIIGHVITKQACEINSLRSVMKILQKIIQDE